VQVYVKTYQMGGKPAKTYTSYEVND